MKQPSYIESYSIPPVFNTTITNQNMQFILCHSRMKYVYYDKEEKMFSDNNEFLYERFLEECELT